MKWLKEHGRLFWIPLLYLAFYYYFILVYGPFFATRIDPEYPYLLNGLNCAQLLFGQIGHVHHPGTPFQMFIGLQLRIWHLLFGEGPILEDIFQRPEFYLQACSHQLALFTAIVLTWAGYWANKLAGVLGLLAIQLSPFLSSVVLLMLMTRYTPDRFVVCVLLLIIALMVREMARQDRNPMKFAIIAGVLAGVAACTKISCLPVLLIPILLTRKYWWLFGVVAVTIFFLFLIPVASRVGDFFAFTGNLATHDGLYGTGNEQVIHWGNILKNLKRIVTFNPGFIVVWGLAFISVVTSLVMKKRNQATWILLAFLLSAMASTFLVAKHFKNYYLASILIFTGLAILLLFQAYRARWRNSSLRNATGILLMLVLVLSLLKLVKDHRQGVDRRTDVWAQIEVFDQLNLGDNKILIDPSWEPAPFVEKGITFGISYIRHHHRYIPLINDMFSHIITYEGTTRPMKKCRVVEFDQSEIYRTNDHLYYFDRRPKRTEEVFADIAEKAAQRNLVMQVDTIFVLAQRSVLDITFIPNEE